jgi:protein-tyrosine-phosphatase
MVKKILFVCKHNILRSRVAEIFFKKFNKSKKYKAESAGLIKWDKRHLVGDKGYEAEKIALRKLNLDFKPNSKGLSSSILKRIDILVIVADDVPPSIFRDEKAFDGKVVVWKIRDVKNKDKDKKKVAEDIIRHIEKKVREFVKELK